MTVEDEARAAALDAYSHKNVRDRYDADLMIAGFIDGAEWQAGRAAKESITLALSWTVRAETAERKLRKIRAWAEPLAGKSGKFGDSDDEVTQMMCQMTDEVIAILDGAS